MQLVAFWKCVSLTAVFDSADKKKMFAVLALSGICAKRWFVVIVLTGLRFTGPTAMFPANVTGNIAVGACRAPFVGQGDCDARRHLLPDLHVASDLRRVRDAYRPAAECHNRCKGAFLVIVQHVGAG